MIKVLPSKSIFLFFVLSLVLLFVNIGMISEVNAAGTVYRVVPGGIASGNCGDTWANGCDLQYALVTKSVSGDELWVKTGTYKPTPTTDRAVSFVLKSGVALYGGFAGTETSRDERDWATNITILSGDIGTADENSDNSYHVVYGDSINNTAVLDGFTITGGNADGSSDNEGGGMAISNGSPTLANLTFSGNTASDTGGGMYMHQGSPTLENITFSNNTSDLHGGGMFNLEGHPVLKNVAFNDNTAELVGGGMTNLSSGSGSVTLEDVTFSGNSGNRGGGLSIQDFSSVTMTNVTFVDNSASTDGGGMYIHYVTATLTNLTFSGNSAGGSGGGMVNSPKSTGSGTITNITFSGNSAGAGGGGMVHKGNGMVTLTNASFTDNYAPNGGGLNISQLNTALMFTLTDVTFSGNEATFGGGMYITEKNTPALNEVTFSGNEASNGGGMYIIGQGAPTLNDVTFSDNVAFDDGGGIYTCESSTPTLTDVTFTGNSASSGGGMFNDMSKPTLENITFIHNHAYHGGGLHNTASSNPVLSNISFFGNDATFGAGIYNYQSNPSLKNVTLSGNTAINSGGGMYNRSTSSPVVENAILWGNSAPTGSEIYNNASTPTISSSDVQGCMPGGVWNTACGTDGGGNLDADPLLGALGTYSGATQTLPLLPGSAAIDMGNDMSCPATDQRGVARPQGAGCDMGAYESRGFSLIKLSGDLQSAMLNMAFPEPLVVGVSSAYDEPMDGGVVNFTAPVSGPSAIPQTSSVPVLAGLASQSLTANGEEGSYGVMVTASGMLETVEFVLQNGGSGYLYLPVIFR